MDGKKLEYKGWVALKEIERLTEKAGEVQETILKAILMQNGETEYLRLLTGEDSSLVTGHPDSEMLCSSGTSAGEPKLMPSIAEDLDRRTFVYNLIMPIMNQYISGLDEGKAMFLYFIKAEMSTPCGLPARTVLTSYYKSKHFKCRTRDAIQLITLARTKPSYARIVTRGMYLGPVAIWSISFHSRRQSHKAWSQCLHQLFFRAISFLERNWVAYAMIYAVVT
ncbi:hypothetical protein NC652_007723 [Populus alba x Populus x berolinensis]|nr:hypothetical protein NC652_007723 [Populus alba x Populus x berolinensis]